MADDDSGTRTFQRRVFYIPGYDPIHPRRYRELYRREGRAQAALSGYTLALKPKKAPGPYGWKVRTVIDGQPTEAAVEVLVWSDIVRGSMDQGVLSTYLQLLRTGWAYLGSGALFRLARLRKGPMIAALYPFGVLLAQLALAVGVGWGLALIVALLTGLWWAGIGPGLAAGWALLRWFKWQDHRIFAYYLMHDYAYSAQSGGANPPDLEARMSAFRQTIAEAMREPVDEVLVVGHSSGAHLAVSILADLVRDGVSGPALGLLTLGQVVPMVSFLPRAVRLRRDLAYLSARTEVTWVDVTAPGDGCAFALCDPVAVTGVAPPDKIWPLVVSAAFTRTLSPNRWKELRWKFFRLHFQYLCAFDNLTGGPDDYDYFRITAGARTLAARYAGRSPSKSRIETPLSGYRSVA